MLAVTRHSWPLIVAGFTTAANSLRATLEIWSAATTSRSRMTNSSDTRYNVAFAHALLDAAGNFDQQRVSRHMAERIVDDFEAVEIDEQHGALAAVAASELDRSVDLLAKHDAVR
jgi:hypothetical protein